MSGSRGCYNDEQRMFGPEDHGGACLGCALHGAGEEAIPNLCTVVQYYVLFIHGQIASGGLGLYRVSRALGWFLNGRLCFRFAPQNKTNETC